MGSVYTVVFTAVGAASEREHQKAREKKSAQLQSSQKVDRQPKAIKPLLT